MKFATCLCSALALGLAACTVTPPYPPSSRTPAPAGVPGAPTYGGAGAGTISPALRERAAGACEAVVAGSTRGRYPQPGNVMFMAERERTYLSPAGLIAVSGEGTFEPDGSEASLPFRYTCTYNPRTGKVDDVQTRY